MDSEEFEKHKSLYMRGKLSPAKFVEITKAYLSNKNSLKIFLGGVQYALEDNWEEAEIAFAKLNPDLFYQSKILNYRGRKKLKEKKFSDALDLFEKGKKPAELMAHRWKKSLYDCKCTLNLLNINYGIAVASAALGRKSKAESSIASVVKNYQKMRELSNGPPGIDQLFPPNLAGFQKFYLDDVIDKIENLDPEKLYSELGDLSQYFPI